MGIPVTINSDDPLLFGNRILDEYEVARVELNLCDVDIAQIASYSFVYSYAPKDIKRRGLLAVRDWLASTTIVDERIMMMMLDVCNWLAITIADEE
jgi:adenosine deaminase